MTKDEWAADRLQLTGTRGNPLQQVDRACIRLDVRLRNKMVEAGGRPVDVVCGRAASGVGQVVLQKRAASARRSSADARDSSQRPERTSWTMRTKSAGWKGFWIARRCSSFRRSVMTFSDVNPEQNTAFTEWLIFFISTYV